MEGHAGERAGRLPALVKSELHQSNPYDYGKPVPAPHLFAGRSALLKEIDYAFGLATSKPPQYKNFAITGPRGIGKTSLLNQVAAMAEQNYGLLASRVELNNELAGNQSALFHQLLEGIVTRLQERHVLGGAQRWADWLFRRTSIEFEVSFVIGKLKAAQKDATQVPQESLRKSLAALSKRAKAVGIPAIVICFDEADLLSKDETTLQALRNTFQQLDGYLLVLSGTQDLLENLGKVFGAMKRFFDQMVLGPLEGSGEVRECLLAPLSDAERPIVTDTFATRVFELTGGRPYIVKLAAFHAYRILKENGGADLQLTPEVERIVLSGVQRTSPEEVGAIDSLAGRGSGEPEAGEASTRSPDPEDRVLDIESQSAEPEEKDDSPIIGLVNQTIAEAIRRHATDLLIIPRQRDVLMRLRIDGRLQDLPVLQKPKHNGLVARFKILANLDISERRLPQDGRISLRMGGQRCDCRVGTAPTIHGESVTVRFDDGDQPAPEALGIDPEDLRDLLSKIERAPGLTLIAGPPRSGTEKLYYAGLAHLGSRGLNVLSGEDHVRALVPEIVQAEIRVQLGLTMAAWIRSMTRHDPDVIAVRPLADPEAAGVLVQTTLAGPKSIAVVQADDAPSALCRVAEMVENRLAVASAVSLVVGQRLLARLCAECHGTKQISPGSAGAACFACRGTGYAGRICVHHLMPVTDEIQQAIKAGGNVNLIREIATRGGLRELRDAALDQVKAGRTTTEEVERVFG